MATVNALNNDLSQSTSYPAANLNVQFTSSYVGTTTASNLAFFTPSTSDNTVYFTQGIIGGITLSPVAYNNRLAYSSSTTNIAAQNTVTSGIIGIYNNNLYFNLINGGAKTIIGGNSPSEGTPSFAVSSTSGYTSFASATSASGYSISAVYSALTSTAAANPTANNCSIVASGSTYASPGIGNLLTTAVAGDTLTFITASNAGCWKIQQRANEYI